ncbi:MAG TPA: error-prone DNA polymerase [Gemmatimonadales bacterium]|nr:error-prone DNA polymerase [Gemmatimonadales bacterium]
MYTELRSHTAFSFGDGAVTPEALARRAAELGYPALGLTDAADLGGVVRFVIEARRQGLRPIVGAELVVDGHPAAFLVRTAEGYRNLAALVTHARVGDLATWDREHPHTTRGRAGLAWADVAGRSAGLVMLTGPASGRLATLLREGRRADTARVLAEWREAFGQRLAIEVQRHDVGPHERARAEALIDLAERERIPWVAANDPRYLDSTGRLVHDMLVALRADLTLDEAAKQGVLFPNGRWRLLPPEEMARQWAAHPAGLEESDRIAAECEFDLSWMRPPLPHFHVPPGHTDDSFLRQCVYQGARARWGDALTDPQRRQLEHELGVIARLGFAGFFLVMWDAVRWARQRGILCQGRGSAANSAVAYCLAITAVDPVKHGLLFERFLSDVRVDGQTEAPDIDLDVEHDRREELLDYVYGHWRRSSAAIAGVVQHYRAPNALLDAMRALGYPAELAFKLSKRIHYYEAAEGADYVEGTLAKQFGLDLDEPRGKALLTLMKGCDGLPRLRSTHVGGFVLSSAPLGEWLPVEHTTMGRTIVQFDKDDLDSLGVPKFDFLGLGGLSLVRRAFDVIERRTGVRPEMYRIPTDDQPTYEMISRGETIGTFQIESRAQIASILKTRPELLYDIVVQVALIRPGPIQARFVHPYTMRRRGLEPVSYRHPWLEPILARTQGLPIFQEQAMAVAMAMARYGAAEADALRRTMGHNRKRNRLLGELARLGERMIERGIDAEVAAEICHDLESFGSYGFPESHAWSFALIAYATAWLRCHYPAEFYLGLLNSWPMGFYSPATLVYEARRQGVDVRPPCLRDGDWECTVEETGDSAGLCTQPGPALRIGWRFVRGMGERTLERLRAARAEGGFESIGDAVRRAALTRFEALALARGGAFGAWEPDRRRAAWEALRVVGDSLPLAPAPPPEAGDGREGRRRYRPRPVSRDEMVYRDYFATGMSLNGHPMERARERLRKGGALDSRELKELQGGEQVIVGGLVTIRQRPQTANGTIFLLLEDEHGFINVVVPSKLVEPNREVVKFATFVLVQGRFERDGPVMNVVGRRFKELKLGRIAYASRDFR